MEKKELINRNLRWKPGCWLLLKHIFCYYELRPQGGPLSWVVTKGDELDWGFVG